MAKTFTTLEKNLLKAKGLSATQVTKLQKAGVTSRADFAIIGDVASLMELGGLDRTVATAVMAWATGKAATGGDAVVVENADTVFCSHCRAKQPKDYKSGELCTACGLQAEPTASCYWCQSAGPGKFCRRCGAEYVPAAELDLALLLKRDGLAKDAIGEKLKGMTAKDKDALWGRVRRG